MEVTEDTATTQVEAESTWCERKLRERRNRNALYVYDGNRSSSYWSPPNNKRTSGTSVDVINKPQIRITKRRRPKKKAASKKVGQRKSKSQIQAGEKPQSRYELTHPTGKCRKYIPAADRPHDSAVSLATRAIAEIAAAEFAAAAAKARAAEAAMGTKFATTVALSECDNSDFINNDFINNNFINSDFINIDQSSPSCSLYNNPRKYYPGILRNAQLKSKMTKQKKRRVQKTLKLTASAEPSIFVPELRLRWPTPTQTPTATPRAAQPSDAPNADEAGAVVGAECYTSNSCETVSAVDAVDTVDAVDAVDDVDAANANNDIESASTSDVTDTDVDSTTSKDTFVQLRAENKVGNILSKCKNMLMFAFSPRPCVGTLGAVAPEDDRSEESQASETCLEQSVSNTAEGQSIDNDIEIVSERGDEPNNLETIDLTNDEKTEIEQIDRDEEQLELMTKAFMAKYMDVIGLNMSHLINEKMINKDKKPAYQVFQSYVYFVLDVDTLLNDLEFVESILRLNVCNASQSVIYVPYVVLRELDKLCNTIEYQYRAQRAIKYLNQKLNTCRNMHAQTALQEDEHLINVASTQDSILNACLQLKPNVSLLVLLTSDPSLGNKAMSNCISVMSKTGMTTQYSEINFHLNNLNNENT